VLWVKKSRSQVDRARPGLFERRLGDGIMHRAKPVAEKLNDYFVIIKRCGRHPSDQRRTRWTWEIQRRSKPLGIKYNGGNFATPQDAKLAGERALIEFLHVRIKR
jgi:hypothetical protein